MSDDIGIDFNPLNYPLCLDIPHQYSAIAWQEHIPFAMALVQLLRPQILVELGVHKGDSYLAFCQAVAAAGLNTKCYGVDTWVGDPHAGYYGEQILSELKGFHDGNYSSFSRLIRGTFDEAARGFAAGSIDLLHIDGMHTYDAVKHDWVTWLPKLSPRAIVLFHDINVREMDFGVWQLWDEIKTTFPNYEFKHGHGLGVLAVGSEIVPAARFLFDLKDKQFALIGQFFARLGHYLTISKAAQNESLRTASREINLEKTLSEQTDKLTEYHIACTNKDVELQRLRLELNDSNTRLTTEVASLHKKLAEYHFACTEKDEQIATREKAIAELASKLSEADARITSNESQLNGLAKRIEETEAALQEQVQRATQNQIHKHDLESQLQRMRETELEFQRLREMDVQRVRDLESQLRTLQHNLAAVTGGMSYKLGRVVTAPLRVILGKP